MHGDARRKTNLPGLLFDVLLGDKQQLSLGIVMGTSMPLVRACALLVLPLVAAGCASVENIDFDKSHNIRSIALLGMRESQYILVKNKNEEAVTTTLLGPLVGGGVDISDQADRSRRFAGALNSGHLRMAPQMLSDLHNDLSAEGLEVTDHPNSFPVFTKDKGLDYSKIDVPEDAILQIWFGGVGYKAFLFSDYQPLVIVYVRLVDSKTKQVLWAHTFSGHDSKVSNVERVPGCEGPTFDSADSLLGDVNGAYQGLVQCNRLIAQRIADTIHFK